MRLSPSPLSLFIEPVLSSESPKAGLDPDSGAAERAIQTANVTIIDTAQKVKVNTTNDSVLQLYIIHLLGISPQLYESMGTMVWAFSIETGKGRSNIPQPRKPGIKPNHSSINLHAHMTL